MILVGLDPGTETGYATWNTQARQFGEVTSLKIHYAMARVLAHPQRGVAELLVIFEDARQRTWFGSRDRNQEKYGAGVREGVGSVKRDCTIWEEFLSDHKIPFIAQAPRGTKRTSEHFKLVTGWTGRTNEHSRDAGLIVYGIDALRAGFLLESAQRDRARAGAMA